MSEYNIDSIQVLDFRSAIRKRVAMYLGDAGNSGALQAVREIITNSIDESLMGYGNKILVEFFEGNRVRITDWGRGVPFGKKDDGTETLVSIYTSAHSGGKFDEKTYKMVAGQNGIGGSAVALSSSFFEVKSRRDGKIATMVLREGFLESYSEEVNPNPKDPTGTSVEFVPAQEVFHLEEIHYSLDDIKEMCKEWAYLNKGLRFEIIDRRQKAQVTTVYHYENGILDMLKEMVSNPIHKEPIHHCLIDGDIQVEIALQWTKGVEKAYTFTNGLNNPEGGTSMTGLRTSITRNMKKVLDLDLSGDMIRRGLVYVISCRVPNPSFANQTKTKVNNVELRSLADRAFSEAIAEYSVKSKKEIDLIRDFFAKEQRADLAAEKAREAVLTHVKQNLEASKKKIILADKLKDSRLHGEDTALVITEGDSALGGLASARNVDKIALYPVRGKVKNALRASIEDVLENKEINDIILALGAGIQERYNSKKLRYGSVWIATDADADGYSIMTLIATMFYVLMPKFIEEGRLKWLRAPLYKIGDGKNAKYAYGDEDLAELQKKGAKGSIIRFKGLGQMSVQDVRDSMFGSQQRVEVLTYAEGRGKIEAQQQLEALMGEDVEPRSDFIFDNIDFEGIEI